MQELRRYVRKLLEAAISSNSAAAGGLALYVNSTQADKVEYVLYSTTGFKEALAKQDVTDDSEESDVVEALYALDPHDVIYGYIVVKAVVGKCWNAGEVKFSAARKGYGPLMYELAMADFGRLMPDHGGGSSPSARNVWTKYSQRSDVKALPFDDVKNPKTKPTEDDCHVYMDFDGDIGYLNAAYQGQGDSAGKSTLVRSHQAFVGQFTAGKSFGKSEVEFALSQMGDEYFGSRYRENV